MSSYPDTVDISQLSVRWGHLSGSVDISLSQGLGLGGRCIVLNPSLLAFAATQRPSGRDSLLPNFFDITVDLQERYIHCSLGCKSSRQSQALSYPFPRSTVYEKGNLLIGPNFA
ncbi:hypothetical protein Syun_014047 [Stephania yunnanensis]|uniref:Uncharacterized protein n=1 Tax=Stephania yunnanensis TaxID=152371 RepID=A0AAP0JKV9_9MAGN